MARSRTSRGGPDRRTRYVLYAIPLIAVLGFGILYAFLTSPTPTHPAAIDFTFQLLLQESNKNSSSVGGIVPSGAIGESGGSWVNNTFNSYGVDVHHSPLYMDLPSVACPGNVPPCTIHVKSTVVYNYTLGDFFHVWGMPLSENDTLNIHSSGNFAWQLCIGADPQTATLSNAWGSLVLKSGMQLVLFYVDYSQAGCSNI